MRTLYESVIQSGLCIGCGACTAVTGSPLRIEMDVYGAYKADKNADIDSEILLNDVCPFAADVFNEDELGQELFAPQAKYDPYLGFILQTYIGYVKEGKYREQGSSGGIGKWMLSELLRQNLVDKVIQVRAKQDMADDQLIYEYVVISTEDDCRNGSKSVYYPVTLAGVLAHIKESPGRYAITGVPCFIKAIRLLSKQEPVFRDRIRYCIGLVCGHLKCTSYADMIGWQLGVEPGNLQSIDFRKKLPGARANEKGVEVTSKSSSDEVKGSDIVQNLFGTNYGYGFFQYKACDFCDDVVAETADITIGDAWLPEYLKDGSGTNVVVVRNEQILRLVENARQENRLALDPVEPDRVIASQAGGFRHRREGLAYRLHLADAAGDWRPQKRVQPQANHISRKRKRIYRLRSQMAERSHSAFLEAKEADDFSVFEREMRPLVQKYERLYRPRFPFIHRIIRAIKRRLPG